jgi:rhodanese-related sulfurtransferase
MALLMFMGAEISEQYFGQKRKWRDCRKLPSSPKLIFSSIFLLLMAVVVLYKNVPSLELNWRLVKSQEQHKIDSRSLYVHPGELLDIMDDARVKSVIIDVRDERDFNIFHIKGSRHATMGRLTDRSFVAELTRLLSNGVVFLVSNDDSTATEAFKILKTQNVLNVYVLDGGINRWLDIFGKNGLCQRIHDHADKTIESLNYRFEKSLGDNYFMAYPSPHHQKYLGQQGEDAFDSGETKEHIAAAQAVRAALTYEKKVKLATPKKQQGG